MMKKIIIYLIKSTPAVMIYRILHIAKIYSLQIISFAKVKYVFPRGENILMDYSVEIKYKENVKVGKGVIIGAMTTIGAHSPIVIGNHVRISKGVSIETASLDIRGELPYKHLSKPIVIGDGVWLGMNCMILGGVTIGSNSVIGAGAVISKNIPPNSICISSSNIIYAKG